MLKYDILNYLLSIGPQRKLLRISESFEERALIAIEDKKQQRHFIAIHMMVSLWLCISCVKHIQLPLAHFSHGWINWIQPLFNTL
jgi:hypothetical protein